MINPNKSYKASQTGIITEVRQRDPYIDQFTVKYGNLEYKGYVSDIPNFKRFKVGDRVKSEAQFSITLDCFLIKKLRKAA